jgi:hypothetical protein
MRRLIEEVSNILFEAKTMYDVVRIGGSIGEKTLHSKRELKGVRCKSKDTEMYTDINLAKEMVKRLNKILSPGEKKYYGIKYVVAEVINGKYTGK